MPNLRFPLFAVVVLACMGTISCSDTKEAAEQTDTLVKAETTGVMLDIDQRKRLGIQVCPVTNQKVTKSTRRIGWLAAPPATETVIRAPVTGFIAIAPKASWPQIGQSLDANADLAQLNVFLSPQELSQLVLAKEDNDIQMQQALVTMELSEAQLKLATTARDAVPGIRIDQLKESYERSKAAYKEAKDKLPFLVQEPYDNGVILKPTMVTSSSRGRVLQVQVSPGQFVQAGDPLWTIGDWSTLWIRVPLFVEDLGKIQSGLPAIFYLPGTTKSVQANPLSIPSPVQPQTRMVDLHFVVSNPEWKLRVGQSIVVEIPESEVYEALIVPKTAILFDGFGQSYCYAAESGSDNFQRRRIEVNSLDGTNAAVIRGLDSDDIVVSIGAEQLASEETKSDLKVEDDD